jgi:hypothetical protein
MEEQSQPSSTPPSQTPTPISGRKKLIALISTILVLSALAAGAYYLKQKSPVVTPPPPPPVAMTPEPVPTPTPDPYIPPDLFEGKNRNYSYPEPKIGGLVTWHYPTRASSLDLFVEDPDGYAEENIKLTYFYELGTIKSGKYKDYKVYLGTFMCNCMGGPAHMRILAKPGAKSVFLTKYSDAMDNIQSDLIDPKKYSLDATFDIPDLNYPETITGPKTGQILKKAAPGFFLSRVYIPFEIREIGVSFTDLVQGTVFVSDPDKEEDYYSILNGHGFYLKAPDWSLVIYEINPDFVNDEGVPDVTWSDGVKNQAPYVHKDITGCGSTNYASVVTLSIQNDLALSGLTNKGQAVYELKDKNHSILKEIYDVKYNPYNETKLPYTEFLKRHPVFFWQDPFDRIVKFENATFQPMAECAKPAIYLYPEKATNVSVKVAPVGGFTYTDPEYGNGWNALAYPDGKLIVDGKEYPYLFWEGRGGLYQTPDKGWVIAQKDVHSFLVEKLAQLGLNGKESADFIEYWEPYMQGSKYYFVTFMGNYALDQIAPLNISPKPDTVIRILMDFKPLDKPIPVLDYRIETPERNGFTVVEWGGVKH